MPKISAVETLQMPGVGPFAWTLVRLSADDGSFGLGDASDSQAPQTAIAAIHELLAPIVLGRDAGIPPELDEIEFLRSEAPRLRFEGHPLRTAKSAVEMALWDLASRQQGQALREFLGGIKEDRPIDLYANINRGLADHEPETMARAASKAVAMGFRTVKCAPFVEFDKQNPRQEHLDSAFRRIEATRSVLSDTTLLVDAHGRLGHAEARIVAKRLEDYDVGWFEEPGLFQDDPDILEAAARETTIPIAAGELLPGPDRYRDLISHGATSVVMTDVKHNGGIAATLAIAQLCKQAERQLSLHNPTGPISTLMSAHICLSIDQTAPLEYSTAQQRFEQSRFLTGEDELVHEGSLVVGDRPGIGVTLARHALQESSVRRTTS